MERELVEDYGDLVDVREFMTDAPGFGSALGGYYSTLYDRQDGRYIPVYQNESDLRAIRAMSWLLAEKVPMAQAWCNRLVDYTIGTGFDWTVTHENPSLQAACKRALDECLEASSWTSDLERETYIREVVDGEWLSEIEYNSGCCHILTREADELTEPTNARALEEWLEIEDFVPSWSFGVLTQAKSTEVPIGYHFRRDQAGTDWDYIKADRVTHWKRNVRAKAKRGFGDFYKPHTYLMRADRVLTNTAEGVSTQAAIAYIVEHPPGATKSNAEAIAAKFAPLTNRQDPNTGEQVRRRRMAPNTRIDIPNGGKYHASLIGGSQGQIYIAVMESALRLSGTIHAFPEGMLTGSYQNANYASSLTAESPFVQGRVAEQLHRASRVKQMFLKIIKAYCEAGRFASSGCKCWDDLRKGLDIAIQPPKIFPRDIANLTTALVAQKAAGWVSDKTAVTELGRDYEAEKDQLEEEKGALSDSTKPSATDGFGGSQPGVFAGISRQQLQRNVKGVADVERELRSGELSASMAKIRLGFLGIPPDQADAIIAATQEGSVESLELNDDGRRIQEAAQRCPTGYTRTHPLVVNGVSYVGGQFIPGATKQQISQAIEKQARKDKAITSPDSIRARRARVMAAFDARVPSSEGMFDTSKYIGIQDASMTPEAITAVTRAAERNGRPTTIRMSGLTMDDFKASRPDLSRDMLRDEIQSDTVRTNPTLIKNQDGSYTIIRGHQAVIASVLMGRPTLQATVLTREQANTAINPPARQTPAAQQARPAVSHSQGTWGHSPMSVSNWMGRNGWSAVDAQRVLRARGVTVSDSSIREGISAGRGNRRVAAPLTEPQQAELNAMRGSAAIAPQSSAGTVAPARPAPIPTASPTPTRTARPVRNQPEPQNNPQHPRKDPGSWTPEERAVVAQGLEAAKQRVSQIAAMDVSGLRQLARPDASQYARVVVSPRTSEFMKQHGAAITGALPGSTVEIGPTSPSSQHAGYEATQVSVVGENGLRMTRQVYTPTEAGKAEGKKPWVYNAYFRLSDDAPKGSGLKAFASQVAELQAHGFDRIEVTAAGAGNHINGADGPFNGYYTWPRFGYAGDLAYNSNAVRNGDYGLPLEHRGATRVEHLMTTKEGRDWFRKHAADGKYQFDLNTESYSYKALRQYYHEETRA